MSAPPRASMELRVVEQLEAPRAPRRVRGRKTGWVAAAAAACAAVATIVAMNQHPAKPDIASGRAGPKLTSSGVPERWWQGNLTVTIDESLGSVWPDSTVGVEGAFDKWRSADDKLPKLTFDSRKAAPLLLEPDGENRIYFAPITLAGHESDLGVTLQYADESTGEIVEADIVINSRHPFAVLATTSESGSSTSDDESESSKGKGKGKGNGNGNDNSESASTGTVASQLSALGMVQGCTAKYDVASVLTHEIGHFWGLGEDMTDTTATMYFSTPPCSVGKRNLKADDIAAVSALYTVPTPSTSGASAPKAAHCSVSTLHREGGGAAAFVGVALVLGAARRRRR